MTTTTIAMIRMESQSALVTDIVSLCSKVTTMATRVNTDSTHALTMVKFGPITILDDDISNESCLSIGQNKLRLNVVFSKNV